MSLEQKITLPHTEMLSGSVGSQYHTRFSEAGADLFVHLANAPSGMDAHQHRPALEAHTKRFDWSYLSIVGAPGADFRGDALVDFFDTCDETEVFDSFNRVLFYGEGRAGYASLCYALAAPGAHVLTITPVQPDMDETERYQPTGRNLLAAGSVTAIEDPAMSGKFDFDRIDALVIRSRYLVPGAEERIIQYGLMAGLLGDVMSGDVDPLSLYADLRARRDHRGHIRRLASTCLGKNQPARAATIIGSFAKRNDNKRFKARFNTLIEEHDLKQFQPL